jgi:hypothetical protein
MLRVRQMQAPLPSSAFHTGFQYTPVDSIPTSVTWHRSSHVLSSRMPSVWVANLRFWYSGALPSWRSTITQTVMVSL